MNYNRPQNSYSMTDQSAPLPLTETNAYTKMQRKFYENGFSQWSLENKNAVIGSFDKLNAWEDYEYLFADIPMINWKNMDVLDFATGVGRNIVMYSDRFKSIDGVDISQTAIDKARVWIEYNNVKNNARLYLCNGIDLSAVPDSAYDLVISTITLQHICVYDIRKSYLNEFFRVTKSGGYVSLQMAYSPAVCETMAHYSENRYDAHSTNGYCDVVITDPNQIRADLEDSGFIQVSCYMRPSGPGDIHHSQWIFVSAIHP
jgi:ubiquinone/menaquinone biosynthesis C-methylase UbiE